MGLKVGVPVGAGVTVSVIDSVCVSVKLSDDETVRVEEELGDKLSVTVKVADIVGVGVSGGVTVVEIVNEVDRV